MNRHPRFRLMMVLLYGAALLQGLTLVSFPASSSLLKQLLHLSDSQYGSIFLPQVAMAIAGSVGGALLVNRLGLKTLFLLSLLFNLLSQALLVSSLWVPMAVTYPWLLLGTASLGLGFGLGGAPLNTLPGLLFSQKVQTAVGMIHATLGLGLALGPLLIAALTAQHMWTIFPAMLGGFCLLTLLSLFGVPVPTPLETASENTVSGSNPHPAKDTVFWLFAMAAVIYSFAEGTFSNWAVIYLADDKLFPAAVAATALSVFWAALAGGRLCISALVLKFSAQRIWQTLPLLMLLPFLLLPTVANPWVGVGLFALAGVSCSGFFPLTVSLATERYRQYVPFVSAMMMAALMTGVGLGSFIVGPLHEYFRLETIYQLSTLYPIVVLALVIWISRIPNPYRQALTALSPKGAL